MPKIKESKAVNWDDLPLMLTKKEISECMRTNLKKVNEWFDSRDFPETDSGKVEKNLFRDWYYKNHDRTNYRNVSRMQISEIVGQTVNEFTLAFMKKISDKEMS